MEKLICYECGLESGEDLTNWSSSDYMGIKVYSCPDHYKEVTKKFHEEVVQREVPASMHLTEIIEKPYVVRCATCLTSQYVERFEDYEGWNITEGEENMYYCPKCSEEG